ncbi:hypothetical protein U1701_02890 [Sphingomonas sp. PB2P19]|uniref:hypothetical protein n=1 Tax=Sphingomonas rhamnosi TaxID=3096156 RepID=UPI002FCC7B3D
MRRMMLGTALLLAGCGAAEKTPDTAVAASGFTPPAPQMPKPLPGQAQTTPLTAYVGKYPHDAVDGVGFYDRSEVANGLVAAVGDPALRERIRGRSGPENPIFQRGKQIAAWGCEAHNCGDHNWTVLIDPTRGKTQVCYHDTATMGTRSRWYADAAPVLRAGACPAEG